MVVEVVMMVYIIMNPIDWQGQGYQDIGEYYADYREQMEDYYHNLYGYHASGTTGTTTKKICYQ